MGVVGRSLAAKDEGADSAGRAETSGAVSERAPVGARAFTMACSMAGRTLKFFSCFFKSDFAAPGAFLDTWISPAHVREGLGDEREGKNLLEEFDNGAFSSISDHSVRIFQKIHQYGDISSKRQSVLLVSLERS
jgi:hypothetical protein